MNYRDLIDQQIHSGTHLSKKHVHPKMQKLFEVGGFNAVFQKSSGQYCWDMEGNQFLDLLSGGGVFLCGRNHPYIHQAVKDSLSLDAPNLSIVNVSMLSGLLAERLLKICGPHYSKVLFSNTGSEVMDLTVRFARFVTRRRRFVSLQGAFHGRTYATASMAGSASLRDGMEPLLQTVTPVRPNDIDQLEREISKGDVAGFFFEPVQGMTGVVMDHDYLRQAQELCDHYGTVMVADEVQTGLCRTGPYFASTAAGIRPGMITVAKILSGGAIPTATTILTEEIYEKVYAKFKSGPAYFSTFAESNPAMAAGLATLDVLEKLDAPTRAAALGDMLRDGIMELAERYDVIEKVEGQGLLLVIYFRESSALALKVQQRLMTAADPAAFGAAINVDMYRHKRIIVQIPSPALNAIKILPPVVMTDKDVEWFLQGLEDTLASYYKETTPLASVASGFVKSAMTSLKKSLPGGLGAVFGQPAPQEPAAEHTIGSAFRERTVYSTETLDEAMPSLHAPPANGHANGHANGTSGHAQLASGEKKKADAHSVAPAHIRRHHPAVQEFHHYDRDITEHCDFLVIGSGPGGIMAARQLARTGKRVIVVEAGPVARTGSFTEDPMDVFNRYYWDSGLRTTRGNVMLPTLHPKVLGGGSVFNCAICLRIPDFQLKRWEKEHGVEGLNTETLAPYWDDVESLLKIAPTPPEVQGMRNALFKKGANALGYGAEPIHRNVTGCKGSARCIVGCPNGAKNSTDYAPVDDVCENGGRVLTSVFCDKLIMRGNKAAGMIGYTVDPVSGEKTHKVRITADCTVVAAGCMHTPVILQRSGIKNRLIGANFRVHPGIFTLGEFDEEVVPWEGASQGYHSLDRLEEGIKLETLWVTPALIAARFPGLGERYKGQLANYRHVSVFDAWVSGDDSVGRVRALPGGGKDVSWNLGHGDVRRMKEATALTAEMLFAAGAHTVYTGIAGEHFTLYDSYDVEGLRDAELSPQDLVTGSQHLFGTTPMGADRDRHVCDSTGAVYGVDNLYVADTSLFPISPAVNPMHPVMGVASYIGDVVGSRY